MFEGGPDLGDCEPRPISTPASTAIFGRGHALATTCLPIVVVQGNTYSVGSADWLLPDSLDLAPYGPITHSNALDETAPTYSLAGVDPTELLVVVFPGSASEEWNRGTRVLHGVKPALSSIPQSACRYADHASRNFPLAVCPLEIGRDYRATLITLCGLHRPVGPYGGAYWRVLDPPPGSGPDLEDARRNARLRLGRITLTDADHATYRARTGEELHLRRIADPSVRPGKGCP
jgi:hypothetical protein